MLGISVRSAAMAMAPSDGTLCVDGFGPGTHAYDAATSVFRVPSFPRADHRGTFSAHAEMTLEPGTHPYGAVRLTR